MQLQYTSKLWDPMLSCFIFEPATVASSWRWLLILNDFAGGWNDVCCYYSWLFCWHTKVDAKDVHDKSYQTDNALKSSNAPDTIIENVSLLYQLHDKIDNARDDQECQTIIDRLQDAFNTPTTALDDVEPPETVKHHGHPKGSNCSLPSNP